MIALIPARSGSKGLPNKNILNFHGKPLLARAVEVANSSPLISEVIVTTDSEEYAEIARQYGASVPFLRPSYLADDNSLAKDVYTYVITRLIKEYSYSISEFVVLQPTSPLREVTDIDGAIKLFIEKKADSVVSVSQAPVPMSWYKLLDKSNKLSSYSPGADSLKNRQDEKTAYIPNGAVYIFNCDFLFGSNSYYSAKSYGYVMPNSRSVDIDSRHDLKFAELLFEELVKKIL